MVDQPPLSITFTAPILITKVQPAVIFKDVFTALESTNDHIKIFVQDYPKFKGRVD